MGAIAEGHASSALTFEDGYQLIEIRSDQVDREMFIAGEASGIPAVLQGLWWMDGNPLPDQVISLGASRWDPETCTTRIHVYGERIWSWDGNVLGRSLYAFVRAVSLVYELRFNQDLTSGTILPIVRLGGKQVRIPGALTKFTMRFVHEGLWLRESWFFGVFYHRYDLRRIVRSDGSRMDAFAEYARAAPARSYLAVRRGKAPGGEGPQR
jgi:hypothetical protein